MVYLKVERLVRGCSKGHLVSKKVNIRRVLSRTPFTLA